MLTLQLAGERADAAALAAARDGCLQQLSALRAAVEALPAALPPSDPDPNAQAELTALRSERDELRQVRPP